jgi:hypothetical protein
MLDTDAVLLHDPRSFFFHGALANITDVLVSSDCVSPSADGRLVRRAHMLPQAPATASKRGRRTQPAILTDARSLASRL